MSESGTSKDQLHSCRDAEESEDIVVPSGSRIINDPGASMALLNRIAESSMDPGYREATAAGKHRHSKWSAIWTLLLCIVFALATTWAVKGLRANSGSVPRAMAQLEEQIEAKQSLVEQLEAESVRLTEELQEREALIAKTHPDDPSLDTTAGVRRVEGPGVVVTVTEAVTTGSVPAVDDGALRTVVNALWAGGAEAVTINGERVAPQTIVRMAGQSILVNLKAVRSPYVIEAVGDQQKLLDSLKTDAAVQSLETKSGMSISKSTSNRLILGSVPLSQTWYLHSPNNETGEE
ncbi:DUF881 domain-containing protein [Actinomycetaceae bacterium MB13-C1-2]|nr:DUF881 domain-containing protein [Actinomycetaceae bacterium MB13-C1-2]